MHESRESVSSSEVDGDDSGYEADADEPKEDSKGAGEADNAEEPDSSTDGTDTDTDTSHNCELVSPSSRSSLLTGSRVCLRC